jgi:hypothetical protein
VPRAFRPQPARGMPGNVKAARKIYRGKNTGDVDSNCDAPLGIHDLAVLFILGENSRSYRATVIATLPVL